MKSMALLFSHQLTEIQKQEAREKWGVKRFLPLPPSLQSQWSNIPAEGDFSYHWMEPFVTWLMENTSTGDLVLIQGEFGAVYVMVSWCHLQERIPIYATTERRYESHRLPDGSIENRHIFRHVNFRRYPVENR